MALKEHPHVVTTSISHDKDTITYDITAKHRSTAVGKVYKINADGKAELPADGEAFDGVIIAVDATQITGAYICGGLRVPLANGATVKRGDALVAGLGAGGANDKGYVKAVAALTALPADTDVDDVAAGDVDSNAKNAAEQTHTRTYAKGVGTTVADILNALKGKGSVLEFDTTHALITL